MDTYWRRIVISTGHNSHIFFLRLYFCEKRNFIIADFIVLFYVQDNNNNRDELLK